MAKLTLSDIASGYQTVTAYNANNALIEAAFENTLSRDGTNIDAATEIAAGATMTVNLTYFTDE